MGKHTESTKFRVTDYVKFNDFEQHRSLTRVIGQMEELLNEHYNRDPKFNNTLKVKMDGEGQTLFFSITLTLSDEYNISGADVKCVLTGK